MMPCEKWFRGHLISVKAELLLQDFQRPDLGRCRLWPCGRQPRQVEGVRCEKILTLLPPASASCANYGYEKSSELLM